ncbi:MAG: hypothetical protein Q8Q25_01885 [bacterium]|nr:hypothetical protein [bacterium]
MSPVKQPWYLFSHGIADTQAQAHRYKQPGIVAEPLTTFDYPDATTRFWRLNFWYTNFGQEKDIEALKHTYGIQQEQMNLAHETNAPVVLFGLSRGASTILNFIAQHNPSNIQAIVLESPYDHVNSIAKHLAYQLHLSSFPHASNLIHYLMSLLFFGYNRNGIQPIDSVPKIQNRNIHILILCSKKDQWVPWKSSRNLFNAGHTQVHFIALDHGKHAKILVGTDRDTYHSVVHAFYKKYGLSHHKDYAVCGEKILSKKS